MKLKYISPLIALILMLNCGPPAALAAPPEIQRQIDVTARVVAAEQALALDLNACTDEMIKKGSFSKEEKENMDARIGEYQQFYRDNAEDIIFAVYYRWTTQSTEPEGVEENQTYYYYDTGYGEAFKRYAVNAQCYANGWQYLPAYIVDGMKDRKTMTLDGMSITARDDSTYVINLKNAKSYEILPASDGTYGYTLIKIRTKKGRTIIDTAFAESGSLQDGYCFPTGKGLGVGQRYRRDIKLVFDTSERPEVTPGEWILLNDLVKQYEAQKSKKLTVKGITVTKDSGGMIIIDMSKVMTPGLEGFLLYGSWSVPYETGYGSGGINPVRVAGTSAKTKAEYYYDTADAVTSHIDLDFTRVEYGDKTVLIKLK